MEVTADFAKSQKKSQSEVEKPRKKLEHKRK